MRQLPLLALLILLAASPAMALSTSDCFDCHSDDSLTKTVEGKEVSLFIDEEIFGQSIHGDLDCFDCHEGLEDAEDEHEEELGKVHCDNCHDDIFDSMEGSSHSPGGAKVAQDLPGCPQCHGKHDIMPHSDSRSSVYVLNVPGTCCRCHASDQLTSRHPSLSSGSCADYEEGMHGMVLFRSGMIFSAVCNDCHGSHDIRSPEQRESRVNRANINETCSACHRGIVAVYKESVHGKLFEENSEEAPTCVSCHGTHKVDRAMDNQFLVTVTARCSGCHKEESDTFRDTYHGQVTGMGYSKAAQCPDCHGAHNILPKEDEASMINPENLVTTCGKCHPGAGRNFVQYMPHADYHDAEHFPGLYYVYLAMVVLLTGTFTFFGIHTLLWFIRAYIEEKRKDRG